MSTSSSVPVVESETRFRDVTIHETADVSDDAVIGEGTKVWNQSQVREHARIGKNCVLSKNVYVDAYVRIGDGVKLQNNVNVYHGVVIEDDVFVGPNATFTNDLHPRAAIWDDDRIAKTTVRKGVSIGAGSTIVCDIEIGENAMIGAGSVVTRDVPPHALVFGSPASIRGYVCTCGERLTSSAESPASLVCEQCSS